MPVYFLAGASWLQLTPTTQGLNLIALTGQTPLSRQQQLVTAIPEQARQMSGDLDWYEAFMAAAMAGDRLRFQLAQAEDQIRRLRRALQAQTPRSDRRGHGGLRNTDVLRDSTYFELVENERQRALSDQQIDKIVDLHLQIEDLQAQVNQERSEVGRLQYQIAALRVEHDQTIDQMREEIERQEAMNQRR